MDFSKPALRKLKNKLWNDQADPQATLTACQNRVQHLLKEDKLNRINKKSHQSHHIKWLKTSDGESPKNSQEKKDSSYVTKIRTNAAVKSNTMQTKRTQNDISEVLNDKNCQSRFLHPVKDPLIWTQN